MKKLSAILVTLLIVITSITSVYASSNTIEEISMNVYIHADGSATIQEVWDMNAVEGTENYKVFNGMGDAYIIDYSVSDENGTYSKEQNWDIDASRASKANKYGIVQNGSSYELCYGIGEYGHHTYTMNYTIVNFIDQYADRQAMNYRLISENIDPKPNKVNINIQSDFAINDTTAEIYAFGFEGFINFGDNSVYVTNQLEDGSYGAINYVNVFVGFKENNYTGTNTEYQNRTYDQILAEAKDGSSYEEDIPWLLISVIMTIGILLAVVLPIVIASVMKYRKKHYFPKSIKFEDDNPLLKKEEIDPFRDIPCQSNIYRFYYISKLANLADEQELKSGLLSAMLLHWMRNGQLEFIKLKGNVFNRNKYEIDFSKEITCENALEEEMLGFFREAAGSNLILEAKEFERWCRKHYSKLEAWFTKVDSLVKKELTSDGSSFVIKSETKFLGFKIPSNKLVYTAKFKEELYRVTGFKNFLLEFSSIEEKQVREVHLWEDYLIFAAVLGLTEKVEKELGRLYPEFNQNSRLDYTYTSFATHHFAYMGVRSSIRAKSAAQMRSSGGGGGSSFGGGGGSFHGGGGGGSR